MGKAKKNTKAAAARKLADPIAGRKTQPKIQQTPETEALRTSKIIPVVKQLSSGPAAERAEALSAANALLQDDTCRFLLLKERIVQKLLEDMVVDPAEEVVVLAWSALRTIAEKEGYDQCVNMFRRDIISHITRALGKLSLAIQAAAANSISMDTNKTIWGFVDSVVALLTCLSETSDSINTAVTKITDLVPFLMGLLIDSSRSTAETKAVVVQCLSSLTDDNDAIIETLLETPEYVNLLIKLQASETPLIRVCACATLHNISLGPSEDAHGVSDALILPTLTDFIKQTSVVDFSSYNPETASPDDKSGIVAAQIALEVVTSIATALGYAVEDLTEDDAAAPSDEINDDADSDDESIPDLSEEHPMNDDDHDMTAPSTTIETDSLPSLVRYLFDNTTPAIITLTQPLASSYPPLQLRALAALNNIGWTADAVCTPTSPFLSKWRAHTYTIWASTITPVLSANTADIELAEAITGAAWAVAKHANGALDLSSNQHKAFISLYQAATTDALRTKCVGVLGCLALPQDRIEVNREVGSFLVGLISAAPETPAEPCAEALNAIFDIYGDAEFAYDEPVFVAGAFNRYLEEAIPKVRTMIRRVDKRKEPELRLRADEAGINLTKFVAYKKKEAAAAAKAKDADTKMK